MATGSGVAQGDAGQAGDQLVIVHHFIYCARRHSGSRKSGDSFGAP
jgi:hypothetical protein